MTSKPSYLSADNLRAFAKTLFTNYNLPDEDAELVAEGLVKADLRGLHSHGVARIPIYCERLRRQCINPRPAIKVEVVTPVAARVNGDDGFGFLVGDRAMDRAIRMAQDYGVGLVAAHRSTHYGMAALYVMQAIRAGCIGLAFTNSSPAMPVWGGRTAFLGASPFAAGAPTGNREAYVLDLAMTVIARGKIRLAAQRDESIQLGLALDREGKPTTDAKKAFEGVLLPFGGVKGSGIGLLMEIMAGVLTGANFGGEVKSLYFDFSGPQNVGHLFMAIRPDLFVPRAIYEARMDALIERTKACPKAGGFEEILIPGEPEARCERFRTRTGIPLTPDIRDALVAEAVRASVSFPQDSPYPLGTSD